MIAGVPRLTLLLLVLWLLLAEGFNHPELMYQAHIMKALWFLAHP